MCKSRAEFLLVCFVTFLTLYSPQLVLASTSIVSDVDELVAVVKGREITSEPSVIKLRDGIYHLRRALKLEHKDITLASLSGQREKVVLTGNGMKKSKKVDNIIRVSASNVTIEGITLQGAGNHLIQVAGEANADNFTLRNSILRDSYEQMVKVSSPGKGNSDGADNGLIENCLFEYSAGIGPQWYIGGIDAHTAKGWTVRNNTFRYIASPEKTQAEHAIHFWNGSENNLVENNLIIDSDRGIGFGLGKRGNIGGIIRNNRIYHRRNNHPFADAGIILENSPGTQVLNNTVILDHRYPRAIEYRFEGTRDVLISGNVTNKAIQARDGATAVVRDNRRERLSAEAAILKEKEGRHLH